MTNTTTRWLLVIFVATLLSLVAAVVGFQFLEPSADPTAGIANDLPPAEQVSTPSAKQRETRYFTQGNLTMVWDTIKPDVRQQVTPISKRSNITPADYVGPDACVDCHQQNHQHWAASSHRWMNAEANESTVLGDFSGNRGMSYRDGQASFLRENDKFIMRYQRDDLVRVYEVSQTIGSRFYQYYVGRGLEGPEPEDHDYYREDFVLPFGYWLDRQAWVPIVHVADELPEGERWDPVETVKPPEKNYQHGIEEVGRARGRIDHSQELALIYKQTCNYCHTTFPLADMFVRMPAQIGPTLPQRSLFELSDYVAQAHPGIYDGSQPPEEFPSDAITAMTGTFISFDARDQAATLGVSCEACHLGCMEHAQAARSLPAFAPISPHLLVFDPPQQLEVGRSAANVNAACGRCHAGNRTTFAAGISTWNSTEFSDAMRGGCYSQASCIDCHNPHQSIGKEWKRTPAEDDASCIRCHEPYGQAEFRKLHTGHAPGSSGDRCMNCHMPHINEGMQDVVRTHTIFSPTQPDMLEQNQPNACNLCHLDKSINWTLSYLKTWYGREYAEALISSNYKDRTEAVGLGWLQQSHEATRLVAAAAFAREDAVWGLPHVAKLLDDPYLLNRQFAQTSVESMLGQQLDQAFGYWYYMTKAERQAPLRRITETIEANRKEPAKP